MRKSTKARSLQRVLGLGFGLAFAFGTMIGVGILRLPGMVAAAAGSPGLIIACWVVGGLFALMGAVSISELITMYPEAGGFRVFARHAFGERAGFAVGWIDWLACVATMSYGSVGAVDFIQTLGVPTEAWGVMPAIALLLIFGVMQAVGVRFGGSITMVTSAAIGGLFLILTAACVMAAPVRQSLPATAAPTIHSSGVFLALVPAIRAIITAYDGWYAPIYTAEECVDTAKNLPKAIIGGALGIMILYVAVNIAFLRVLPVSVLAASTLPAADAARLVLPVGGAALITVLSILVMLSLINSNMIMGPRVLFSMAREGWVSQKAAVLSQGGAPVVAIAVTVAMASLVVATGSFNQIVALFAVLITLYYIAAFLAVFVLRIRSPERTRPFRATGYPGTTLVVLSGYVAFLIAAAIEDWRSVLAAILFLSLCVPAYSMAARARTRLAPSIT